MFHSTRLKLTTWYLLIIMFVSVTFSLVIYNVLMHEVGRFDQMQRVRITYRMQQGQDGLQDFLPQRSFVPPSFDPELVDEVRQRILIALLLVNSGILVLSGVLGYVLAGRTLKPIKEMVDEQNRFISDASHELRTPLTSLKTAFEVYLRQSKHTREEAKILVGESLSEVNRLISLSQSLLQLAEVEMGATQTYTENVELGDVIEEAVRMIKPIAKEKNIQISSNKTKSAVRGNHYALVEVLTILLENAIKYSNKGKKVQIVTKEVGTSVLISMKDHGVGIAQKDVPHIFDRFYRADIARTNEAIHGYGLGLSIAKKIASAHNGALTVTSNSGDGSTFTLRLPSASLQNTRLD